MTVLTLEFFPLGIGIYMYLSSLPIAPILHCSMRSQPRPTKHRFPSRERERERESKKENESEAERQTDPLR